MLTDKERQKIIEEENLRKQVRGASPTDQLSSNISWGCAIVVIAICAVGAIFAALVFSGFLKTIHS